MKRVLITILTVLAIASFATPSAQASQVPPTRTASATFCCRYKEVRMSHGKVKWVKDGAKFETKDGNVWCVYDTKHKYHKGMKVKITFNTKGTRNKLDDEIIKIRVDK